MDGFDSQIDPRFGRAYAFLIVDLETGMIAAEFFNSAASAAQGAGTAASIAMNINDVDVVISGSFGPKAIESLEAFEIEMWAAREGLTAKEVLDQFAKGNLKKLEMKVY